MPKNTSGGKKHKKGKTAIGNDENRSLLEAGPGQCYAVVTKLCGNSMINCRVYHRTVTRDSRGNESVSFSTEEKIGVIRNSLKKKKIFINANNVILVCLRDFEPGKVDVIYSYKDHEVKKMQRKNWIPNINSSEGGGDDGVDYEFIDENESNSDSDNEFKPKKNSREVNRQNRREKSNAEPYLVLPDNFGESEGEEYENYSKNAAVDDNFINNI